VVVQSPAIAVARHARACLPSPGPAAQPPTLPQSSSSRHAEPRPPPPHLVPSGLDTRSPHPCQEFREPPCPPPPPPPDGDNNTGNQRSVDATMEPPPEDDRPRVTQSTSSSSPPPTTGGGRGAEQCALSLPGSCRCSVGYLSAVIPCRRHCRRGIFGAEAEVVVVAGRGGSGRRGSGSVLMPFFCARCCMRMQ
jgi:hypothetical protein